MCCFPLDAASFGSLKFLLLAAAEVLDLVTRGTAGLGCGAPAEAPLEGGFGISD